MKKITKVNKIAFRLFLIISAVICIMGFLIAYIPSRMTEKHTNKIVNLYLNDAGYDMEAFNKKWEGEIQSFNLESDLGHIIPVYYIAQNDNYDNRTVILVHWHESNHVAMYPIAEQFLNKGWNVVLYDQRAHGKNTAKTVTFGYLESRDLGQVVEYTKDKAGNNPVGVLGQSMGAATIGYYLGSDEAGDNLAFAVMDGSYSDMFGEIAWEISKGKVKVFANALTSLGSAFSNALYGYSFKDIDIVEKIKNSSAPTIIIHSKLDKKCPYYMGAELFQAIPHENKVHITFENSEHLFSFWDEPDRYSEELFMYINDYISSN